MISDSAKIDASRKAVEPYNGIVEDVGKGYVYIETFAWAVVGLRSRESDLWASGYRQERWIAA